MEATDKMDPEVRHSPPNKELIAQGVGNLVAGLIGGIPVTQVIVRSSANFNLVLNLNCQHFCTDGGFC